MTDAVFMIGWEYPPHNSGGLGVACQGLTQALAEDGQRIYFTLPYKSPVQLSHMQVLGCYNQAWFDGDSQYHAQFGGPVSAYGASQQLQSSRMLTQDLAAEDLRALPQSELEQRVTEYSKYVTAEAKKHAAKYHGSHAHDWMSFPAATQVKEKTGKPFIAHVHSTEFDRIPNGYGSQYIHQTEHDGLQAADHIIAVSNYTKQIIVNKYAIDPAKIDVVYNGIDPLHPDAHIVKRHFAPNRPVIVFMGRLTMQKGAEYFLQLARRVLHELPEALFIMAGHGDQYTSLLLKNADMKLSAHLLFAGFVRGQQRDDLLNRADVFVMPSLSEPFGLVALEAAQRHTPVIVSKNSGVAEVMTASVVTEFWDVEAMSQEIVGLVQDKDRAEKTVQNQLNQVNDLTWQRAATDVRSIYRKVFKGK